MTYEECARKGSYCYCMVSVGEGGACVDVHAADCVIDSDWFAWSLTTCKECCCVELTISLCRSHRPSHALQNICEQKSCRQSGCSP